MLSPAGNANVIFEARACAILYNLLLSQEHNRPFLIPANVCPVVPLTFQKAQRPFELVDISGDDLCMAPGRCLDRISENPGKYAGVLYVRSYGLENDATALFSAIKQHELMVIDDRCLCRPDFEAAAAEPDADVTLYSTGYAKPVDLGYGGFAHCKESVRYQRHAAPYSVAARDEVTRRYKQAIAGGEACEAGAADWLDLAAPAQSWADYSAEAREAREAAAAHRARLNAIYAEALPEEICLPASFQNWRFHIRVTHPQRLIERLFAADLFASRHYASLGGIFAAGRFPEAERLHGEIVNLFNDRYFSAEQARAASAVVLEHLAQENH